jgi:hypothetical protein
MTEIARPSVSFIGSAGAVWRALAPRERFRRSAPLLQSGLRFRLDDMRERLRRLEERGLKEAPASARGDGRSWSQQT